MSTLSLITLPESDLAPSADYDQFQSLVNATLKTIAATSKRVYLQTYKLWTGWCANNQINPLDLTFSSVAAFLEQQSISKATRQRQLSALRKLAEMLSILDYANPARNAAYMSLKKLKVGYMEGNGVERDRHALSPAQADKVLRVWDGNRKVDRRNRAIVALLFMTGLRRSEVTALKWSDINLDDAILKVRHGKGDVERDAAIAGETALAALRDWQTVLGADRMYVFPSLLKGDKIGTDEPTDDQTVYRVVKATEKQSSVKFSPHTARRTFITEALTNHTPLADVQAQAGHKQEATTLRYARPVEAKARRSLLRLRYG